MFQYFFFIILYPTLLILSILVGTKYASYRLNLNKSWKNIGLESSLMSIYALLLSFALAGSSNNASERNEEIYDVADRLSLIVKKSKFFEPELQNTVHKYLKGFFDIHEHNLNANAAETGVVISKVISNDQKLDDFLISYLNKYPASKSEIGELTTNTSGLRSAYIRLTQNYGKTTPSLIIAILILYSFMMGFLIGFMKKFHSNETFIVSTIFVIISAVMIGAIWDQDHPGIGFIRPKYESINEVSNLFKAYLTRHHL